MLCTMPNHLPIDLWHPQPTPVQAIPQARWDEATLICKALAGDLAAFNQLVYTYQTMAYSVAYRILRREDAAADAVQESFFKAYRALGQYRGGQFKTWLMRIVMNSCYDQLRDQRRHPSTSLEDLPVASDQSRLLADPAERPDAYVERMELRGWLEQGIGALPAEQRAVLVLYDIEGYSYEEIAQILAISLGTVKSRLSRARTKVRDFLLARDGFRQERTLML
jgi:RNA polymerase sigma-70 factor (ECF subfamily)